MHRVHHVLMTRGLREVTLQARTSMPSDQFRQYEDTERSGRPNHGESMTSLFIVAKLPVPLLELIYAQLGFERPDALNIGSGFGTR